MVLKFWLFNILDHEEVASTWCNESVPESDSTPHINVGPKFQCSIPAVMPSYHRVTQDRSPEDLLWDPGILQCSDSEGTYYRITCERVVLKLVRVTLQSTCTWTLRAARPFPEAAGIRSTPCIYYTCAAATFTWVSNLTRLKFLSVAKILHCFDLHLPQEAMLKLMQPTPNLHNGHPLLTYQ